jgi:ribosomal protein S18 acetylase RimI-like enzyme
MAQVPQHSERSAPFVEYREASEADAEAIAALHANSWRRHYRGAYSDLYLDGDVVTDRQLVWQERLAPPRHHQSTICAESSAQLLGFAHTVFDHDPKWGTLLDNLHVRSEMKGQGIGTRLLSQAASALRRHQPEGTLYLWVLDQNTAAQSFYEARGGIRVGTERRGPFPGGGTALAHRYAWRQPAQLIRQDGSYQSA